MISVTDLRPGNFFIYDGNLYRVLEANHNKTARAAANVRVKMKNMRSGGTTEMTFGGGDKVEPAYLDKDIMTYLYDTGDAFVFMNNETYDQIEIASSRLEWEKNFLKENTNVAVTSYQGEVLGVEFTESNLPFLVTEAEQAVKGDTATGAMKNAIIETGLQIKVPLFIETGEMVLVSTIDGSYVKRA